MTRQNALKYILPICGVLLLALLAAWAFRLPPVSALTERGSPPVAGPSQPVEQVAGYSYDVIQVAGTGTATGTPDIANLALGVSVRSTPVADAKESADDAVQAILTALKANGVADKDITTSNFRVYEDYDYTDQGRVRLGYVVDYDLKVTVRSIDSTGAVIDAAIAAGGDYVVFDRLSYSFSDKAAMERKARQAAVAELRGKAAQLAQFSNRRLGDLVAITENPVGDVFDSAFRELAAATTDSTPIMVGEESVTVIVSGVYELR